MVGDSRTLLIISLIRFLAVFAGAYTWLSTMPLKIFPAAAIGGIFGLVIGVLLHAGLDFMQGALGARFVMTGFTVTDGITYFTSGV